MSSGQKSPRDAVDLYLRRAAQGRTFALNPLFVRLFGTVEAISKPQSRGETGAKLL